MKAYLTLLFMSLALCLMAQDLKLQDTSKPTSLWYYTQNTVTYHTFAFQNKYNKRWEAYMQMKDSVPRIELYGEWRLQIEAGKSFLVPVSYFEPSIAFIDPDTLATYKLRYINELTTMEQYVALEALQDYIERTLGADKVPDSAKLLSLVSNKRAFENSGRRVLVEDMTVDYYNYTDATKLIEAVR
jgi:hypothetical protein